MRRLASVDRPRLSTVAVPIGREFAGPIQDGEAFCRAILEQVLFEIDMRITDDEFYDAVQDLLLEALGLEKRYDPERSTNFARYAHYILSRRVIDRVPRQLLGRSGNRIAERSAQALDPVYEQAAVRGELGEALALLQSGDDPHRGDTAGGLQAVRDRRLARAAGILGLRAAS